MKLVLASDDAEYLVAAHPAGLPVQPAADEVVRLDVHLDGDRIFSGLAELYWRLFKRGPWVVEVRRWPDDGTPLSMEQVRDRAAAKQRYKALASLVEAGHWPEAGRA
jgi:uncharacterized protein YeaC (DUF1315 family)